MSGPVQANQIDHGGAQPERCHSTAMLHRQSSREGAKDAMHAMSDQMAPMQSLEMMHGSCSQ